MEPNKRGRSSSWGYNRGSRNYWRGRSNFRGANKRYSRNRWKNTTHQQQPADEIAENDGPRQSLITNIYPVIPCPYTGWKLYFPEVVYSENSLHLKRIQILQEMLLEWKTVVNKEEIQSRGSFNVDAKDLTSYDNLKEEWPSFMEDLKETPENILNSLGLAMHQILFGQLELPKQQGNEIASQNIHSKDFPVVHARIINYEPLTPLKNIKGIYFGKFISIKGSVIRLSSIKSVNTKMAFKCETCGELQVLTFSDWKYTVPTKCTVKECRSRQFLPDCLSPFTETIDWQSIKIQENITDRQRESGRVPRTIECELTSDLVGTCTPGDNVIVTGIVKVSNSTAGNSRQNKDKCTFALYIHANSVTNCKGNSSDRNQKLNSGISLEFSYKDLYAIQEIQSENNLFRLIVASLCPTIYGHEIVKAGLILGLFGGTSKYTDEKISLSKRGDPHILVVGDPGLGKSQMLQACANIAPRGVYVSANTTTTSGLTVTLTKDSSSDFALEAGALVLADQGCCCIDEFDKMSNQHQALLEAMEQQCISVAKSGVICNMPARTSILAAANPVGGHYNKAKTVSENLKMGSALLSRFDLVFILLDKHDQELDNMLSKHVMAMHSGKKMGLPGSQIKKTSLLPDELAAKQQWERDKPLSEYLKYAPDEIVDPIPHQILRKYVAYARKYVHPEISPDAVKVLKQFYQQLRMNRQTADSTPITTRQLESLIRLTEARARLELREDATDKDAQDVIEIMKHSMIDTYSDEFGLLDFQRSQHGSGMNSRSQAKKFIAILTRISDQTYNSLFTVQQMRQIAKDAGINVPYFGDFIDSLNNQNYLLKKGPGVYHLQTAGF